MPHGPGITSWQATSLPPFRVRWTMLLDSQQHEGRGGEEMARVGVRVAHRTRLWPFSLSQGRGKFTDVGKVHPQI